MAISKKAVFLYEGKPVKGMIIHDGQGLFRIHEQTHQVEEVELKYATSAVEFDTMYHYTAALSKEKALEKYKRYKEAEERKTNKKPYLN